MSSKEGEILLSLLICSIPERIESLSTMYNQIVPQIKNKPVELLVLTDNRTMSIGHKRQKLNEIATGKYVAHIDDDDEIASNYVDTLLEKIRQDDYDCINFVCMVYINDDPPKPCKYSKDYEYKTFADHITRKPNSRCCYKRSVALKHSYADFPYAEDDDWGIRASQDIVKECNIDNVLYSYKFKNKPESWFMTRPYRIQYGVSD